VQGIVHGHHGAILVDSAPQRGTTFRIYLPLAGADTDVPPEAAPSVAVAERATGARSGLVLVVDDEPVVRTTTQAMVEHLGFSVLTAVDGREALDLFRRVGEQVAFVLLDLTMPDMDGLETLVELRHLRPDVRVLLASGFDQTEISERCGRERPDGFLQKPFQLETLQAAIAQVLRA